MMLAACVVRGGCSGECGQQRHPGWGWEVQRAMTMTALPCIIGVGTWRG